MFEYKTQGTCATKIRFDLVDNKIHNVSFENGCNGNLKAISVLVEGMETEGVLSKFRGLRCGYRNTSCADQLARAIEHVK